jgi:hypothetical protein
LSERLSRNFVVWDGEGARAPGRERKPQNYVLLGTYDGEEHNYIRGERLSTFACLSFIIETGKAHPGAAHVAFSFNYDVNMILRSLTPKQFEYLSETNHCLIGNYRIEHVPDKWFQVTRYGPTYPAIQTDRVTVRIFDVWGFFQSSLVSALKSVIPAEHPLMQRMGEIEAGKELRDQFTYADIEFITDYWKIENVLFYELVNRLRANLYEVGLHIASWHGPGALATHVFRTREIRAHKSDCGPDVYDRARLAYSGGRFERFHVGRYQNVHGFDINSAYPYAIAQLPSLSTGRWEYRGSVSNISQFGLYHVRIEGPLIIRAPSPLFRRDHRGDVTYPWRLDGWYWSPEVKALLDTLHTMHERDQRAVKILDAWEFIDESGERPFSFVKEMYAERRALKAAGNGAQMALKLALNSLYGKMAQRAGWERTGNAPRWHQLEWAGWVTSYTRAMLFRVMQSMPYDKLIAVETDGIYCDATPEELGITHSEELGGWEVTAYDELLYIQSGIYAKRQGDEWSIKFRGLDKDSFGKTAADTAAYIAEHCKLLTAKTRDWPPVVGKTTRFIGYKNALLRERSQRGPMKIHHCVWETEPVEIACGKIGKRIHSFGICEACRLGLNAYEMPHETVINTPGGFRGAFDIQSYPHDIPWMDSDIAWWRDAET